MKPTTKRSSQRANPEGQMTICKSAKPIAEWDETFPVWLYASHGTCPSWFFYKSYPKNLYGFAHFSVAYPVGHPERAK